MVENKAVDDLSQMIETNVYGVVHKIIRDYSDILVSVLRYDYSDFDVTGAIHTTDPSEKQKIIAEVREKVKEEDVFEMDIPYVGLFLLRREYLADAKAITDEVIEYGEALITEKGGRAAVSALAEDERNQVAQEIETKVKDKTNELSLQRCVVYPFDFAEKLEKGQVPYGIYPVLLDKLTEISGYANVEIKRV